MKLFRFKLISEPKERQYGILFRLLGIDFMVCISGYINDWALIDLAAFRRGLLGIFAQVLFLSAYIGEPKDNLYDEQKVKLEEK